MVYKKLQVANNVKGKLDAGLSAIGTSLIIQTVYSSLFPDHNGTTDKDYLLTLEQKDIVTKAVLKREIVLVTKKVGNVFTIVRAYGFCPASDTATSQTNTAFSFESDDEVFMNVVAEGYEDLQEAIEEKAQDNEVVHLSGTEMINGQKTFGVIPFLPEALPSNPNHSASKNYVDQRTEKGSFNVLSDFVYSKGLVVSFIGDTLTYTLTYNGNGKVKTISDGIYIRNISYKNGNINGSTRILL